MSDDLAHGWTDDAITRLEGRIHALYSVAGRDVQKKLNKYLARFRRDNAKFLRQMKDGEITPETYRDWLAGQVFQQRRFYQTLQDLAKSLTRTNEAAMAIVNDAAAEVFAMNANWESFQIEQGLNAAMGFEFYDETTVRMLLRDEPNLLPPSRVKIEEDEAWNMRAIARQITQGILQGEKLDEVAHRLRKVARMTENQSLTHARTAMTAAQNAGRQETYNRAAKMGIGIKKRWMATLDGHTRREHADADGQTVERSARFTVGGHGMLYPGDRNAPAHLVYNCRCRTVGVLTDHVMSEGKRRPNLQELGDTVVQKPIKYMTYREWERLKRGR